MEKFKSKNMNEAQVDEIVELMDGEHGETLEMWRKENYDQGQGVGMVGGALITLFIGVCVKGAMTLGKTAWDLGKSFVKTVAENAP